MSKKIDSSEIINNAKKILEEEGTTFSKELSPIETINKYLIPAMENSKDTLAVLYDYKPREKFGFVGKLKNMILNKIKNVTLSTIEKQAIRQQKYNDLVFQSIQKLKIEIEELKQKKA